MYKLEPVLKVKDLVKHFPGTRAVDTVSFNVFPVKRSGLSGNREAAKQHWQGPFWSLFLPMQAGSALRTKRFPGSQKKN